MNIAWCELWLVLRASAFGHVCGLLTFVVGIFVFFATVIWWLDAMERQDKGQAARPIQKTLLSLWAAFFFFMCGAIFTPTTKECAAIIVLPRIANSAFINETLPKEGGEVYGLFKEWLRERARGEAEKCD